MDAIKEIMAGIFVVEQGERYAGIMQTNPFIIESDDGLIFLDPGFPLDETEDVYRSLIRSWKKQPSAVLLTHGHTDHYGMAGFLQSEFDMPVWVHRADSTRVLKGVSVEVEELCEQLLMRWRAFGMSEHEKEWAKNKVNEFNIVHHEIDAVNTFEDGHLFHWGGLKLIAIHAPGHTQGSCCFYEPERKILFTGDTLFPPNVRTPLPGPLFGDPNGRMNVYLSSLERLRGLDVEVVLPGHGEAFSRYSERIQKAFEYYQGLIDTVIQAVSKASSLTVSELVQSLAPDADEYLRFILTGEVFDVLEVLKEDNKVVSVVDSDVLRWVKT